MDITISGPILSAISSSTKPPSSDGGGDPRYPYANSVFKRLAGEFDAGNAHVPVEEIPVPPPYPSGPNYHPGPH